MADSKYIQKWTTAAAVTIASAGTAVTLLADASVHTVAIKVQASYGNTGKVYVGDSTVDSSNGCELKPGDVLIQSATDVNAFPYVIRPSDMFVDTETNDNSVRISYLTKVVI